MTKLSRRGEVFVLDIGDEDKDSEHRLDPARIAAIGAALDEVDSSGTGPAALVTTATGKFYSNGLEPGHFAGTPDEVVAYLNAFERLLARLLTSETPAVAALQGHVYAGGLLLALAHDERLMRVDRGFACLPEVLIGFPFPAGMARLIQARLNPQTAHTAMCAGQRYSGPEAHEAGIVDGTAAKHDLLPAAIARAGELAPLRGRTLGTIKREKYAGVAGQLGQHRDADSTT